MENQGGAVKTSRIYPNGGFEYMIGNTDWSVEYLQNIKLATVDSNSAPITIPYDFDHAGIVNTLTPCPPKNYIYLP